MVLEIEGLYKSFDGEIVLNDVSFQMDKGEIVAVIGPSGAGKTTLLRCINGLEKSDRGLIKIDGYPVCSDKKDNVQRCSKKELKEIRKKVGYVFQNFNLFPHMSVMENITEAPIYVAKMDKKEAEKKAKGLLERLGLSEKVFAYPFQLSGGQQQRVAIARACALDPILMCFDEPTSALDPEMRGGIANIIEGLAEDNMAILVITHDMSFAKRIAHRMLFMEDGSLTEVGKKENGFEDMDSKRIMSYING